MQITFKTQEEIVGLLHVHDAGEAGISNILWGDKIFPHSERHLLGKTIEVFPSTAENNHYILKISTGEYLDVHPAWIYKTHDYHDMIGRGIWLQTNMAINICARSRRKVGTDDLCSMISVYVVFGGDLTTKEKLMEKSFKGKSETTVRLTARESVQLQRLEEYIIKVFTDYYNHPSNAGVTRHDNRNGFKFS